MTIVNKNWNWSIVKHILIKSSFHYYLLIESSEKKWKKKKTKLIN